MGPLDDFCCQNPVAHMSGCAQKEEDANSAPSGTWSESTRNPSARRSCSTMLRTAAASIVRGPSLPPVSSLFAPISPARRTSMALCTKLRPRACGRGRALCAVAAESHPPHPTRCWTLRVGQPDWKAGGGSQQAAAHTASSTTWAHLTRHERRRERPRDALSPLLPRSSFLLVACMGVPVQDRGAHWRTPAYARLVRAEQDKEVHLRACAASAPTAGRPPPLGSHSIWRKRPPAIIAP